MDDSSKPSLADDPAFLASLSELDRGLIPNDDRAPVSPQPQRPAPRPGPLAPAAPVSRSTPLASTASAPRSAPLAPAAPRRAERPAPLVAASARQPIAPALPVLSVAPGRRPLLDLFPPSALAPPAATARSLERPTGERRSARPEAFMPELDQAQTYEAFYGLNEKPFSLSSDPRFLYHSTSHDRVAQEMLSAIRNRASLVVVTGETGAGKTMLCRAVAEQIDRRTLTSLVLEPFASIDELIRTILVDFGVISRDDLAGGRLARASRQDLTAALEEFLQSLVPLQAFAVVLIDEAQNLPSEVLEEIRALCVEGGERLLQVALVGQPALLKALGRPELRPLAKRASVRVRLGPLAADEIVGYVTHRLAVAGGNARVEFDDQALTRVYELAAGVPRVVNMLCDRALTLGCDASASLIDEALIDRAAEDLLIEAPESRMSFLGQTALGIAVLLLLALLGGAAAALVFHDRLSQMVVMWQAVPAAPRPPVLPRPAPVTPARPPPSEPDRPPL